MATEIINPTHPTSRHKLTSRNIYVQLCETYKPIMPLHKLEKQKKNGKNGKTRK